MPSIEEDERLRKEAAAHGHKYVSPYEAQIPKEGTVAPPHEPWNAHAGGHAAHEAQADTQHVFRGPSGEHLVKTGAEQAINAEQAAMEHDLKPERLEGETEEGYRDRLETARQAYEFRQREKAAVVDAKRRPGEGEEEYARRLAKAKFEAAKARPGIASPQDIGKKAAPNKVRGSCRTTLSKRRCADFAAPPDLAHSTLPSAAARGRRVPSLASSKALMRPVISSSIPRSDWRQRK